MQKLYLALILLCTLAHFYRKFYLIWFHISKESPKLVFITPFSSKHEYVLIKDLMKILYFNRRDIYGLGRTLSEKYDLGVRPAKRFFSQFSTLRRRSLESSGIRGGETATPNKQSYPRVPFAVCRSIETLYIDIADFLPKEAVGDRDIR